MKRRRKEKKKGKEEELFNDHFRNSVKKALMKRALPVIKSLYIHMYIYVIYSSIYIFVEDVYRYLYVLHFNSVIGVLQRAQTTGDV